MSGRYDLWHATGARSLRVLWVAQELGIADRFDVHPVIFPPRVSSPEYLDVNPLGTLPYFADGALKMTESMAICQYLAGRRQPNSLIVTPDEAGYGDYLQYCFFGETEMMQPVGTLVGQMFSASEDRSEAVEDEARARWRMLQKPVQRILEGGAEFVAAGRFTLADVSVGYTLGLLVLLGRRDLLAPAVADYADRLARRPALVRANA